MSQIKCPSCGQMESEYASNCSSCGSDMPLFSYQDTQARKTSTPKPDDILEPGEMLGHFRISQILGEGGMGRVYQAFDTRLDRFVAIKVLRSGFAGKDDHLLLEEAKLASSLNHPNIVTIHEVSNDNDPFFFVMEWIDGQSLDKLIGEEGMTPDEVLEYGTLIAAGLARAHQAGIIHRDIKPGNIMVSKENRVTVLDFGLAGLRSQQKLDNSLRGTLPYMSPEQTRGLGNAHSDIFSFGTLLYQMLSGLLPFDGESREEIIDAICNSEPKPLETSSRLKTLVMDCLAKDMTKRPQTMDEVVSRLREIREAIHSQNRKRDLWIGVAVMALLILLLIPFRNRDMDETSELRELAVLPFRNISGDPLLQTFCDGLAEALGDRLTRLESTGSGFWVVPAAEVRRLGDVSSSQLHNHFGVDLVITGSIQHSGRVRLLNLRVIEAQTSRQIDTTTIEIDEQHLFEAQGQIIRETLSLLEFPVTPEVEVIIDEGHEPYFGAFRLYLEGLGYLYRYDQADNLNRAVTTFEKAIDLDADYVPSRIGYSEACRQKWRQTREAQWLERAMKALEEAAERHPDYAELEINMGEIFMERGDYTKALTHYQAGLKLIPDHAGGMFGLARAKAALGEDAEPDFKQALTKHPNNWLGYKWLGTYYYNAGRFADAEKVDRHLIELTPNNQFGYMNLATDLYMQDKLEEALAMLDRALVFGSDARIHANKGTWLFFDQDYEAAVDEFQKAVELKPGDYRLWANLGDALRWAPERRPQMNEAYDKAVELAREEQRVNPQSVHLKIIIARCLAKAGKTQAASAEIEGLTPPDNVDLLFQWIQIVELLGDRDQALSLLEILLERGYARDEIDRDPELGGLRKDPRFIEIMASKGL